MKLRMHLLILAVLVVGFGLLGASRRSSYTNITSDPDFIYGFSVAEIPTAIAVEDCKFLKEALPSAPYILKVTPTDTPECFFGGRQQKVCIQKIFSGEGLEIGEEVYITSDRWKVYPADGTMDTGFVNILQEDTEYLIFSSGSIGYTDDDIAVFRLQSGQYIAPVFRYGSCENIVYPTSGETTYVPYAEVSDNEFFAMEAEGMETFLSLKQELFNLYP